MTVALAVGPQRRELSIMVCDAPVDQLLLDFDSMESDEWNNSNFVDGLT